MLDAFGGLRDWLMHLVAIVMFITFVEMMLPQSGLDKYVKMVLGFFLVLFLIKPIVNIDVPKLLQGQPGDRLQILTELNRGIAPVETQAVISKGEAIADTSAAEIWSDKAKALGEQIEATLGLLAGVDGARADVKIDGDGNVNGIRIFMAKGADPPLAQKIKRYLTTTYQLPDKSIQISGDGGISSVHP